VGVGDPGGEEEADDDGDEGGGGEEGEGEGESGWGYREVVTVRSLEVGERGGAGLDEG